MIDARLETIASGAKSRYGESLAIVIWDLETDVLVERNSQKAFALGELTRLPIAYAALAKAERSAAGAGAIESQLEAMLIADNLAAGDALYAYAGGADGINAALRDGSVTAMLVRTNPSGVAADVAARKDFQQGGDNAASAAGIALLLSEIARGEVLAPQSRLRLIDILAKSRQPSALRSGLPPGTRVAEVAGPSVDGFSAAGIAQINGRGVVIVAMVGGGSASAAQRAGLLASVATAAFDTTARVLP